MVGDFVVQVFSDFQVSELNDKKQDPRGKEPVIVVNRLISKADRIIITLVNTRFCSFKKINSIPISISKNSIRIEKVKPNITNIDFRKLLKINS